MRILVSPLDWGLGHAARCIPVIQHLLDKNNEVVLAADGAPLALLREEIPQLDYAELKGYKVRYSAWLPASAMVALQVPKINRAIAREHRELENIISSKKIDAVISDNRYGLWSDKVPCAIITHQLNIQSAFFKGMLKAKTIAHLQKFSIIWIPDYKQGDNLSGALSHPAPQGINAKYIGILSRFENAGERKEMKYDLLALLSGPEPQRTLLERKIIKQVKRTGNMKAFIVRGLPGGKPLPPDKNIETIAHLDKNSLFEKILCSKAILARPGYSTIMDLAAIGGKKVVFIPTPGQTEQEYLAMYLEAEGLAVSAAQNHFSLKDAWRKVFASQGFNNKLYKPIYKEAIDEWLKEIKN